MISDICSRNTDQSEWKMDGNECESSCNNSQKDEMKEGKPPCPGITGAEATRLRQKTLL